ncbi:MAG: hypothetical protein C0594_05435, partial [Marinilabiliales bacterium]
MKKLLSFVFLILFFNLVYAQDLLLFEQKRPEVYVVKYHNNNTVTDKLIQVLANAQKSSVYSTEYRFSYVQEIRLLRSGYKIEVKFILSNFEVSGKTVYRGFPLNSLLTPSALSCTVQIPNKLNKRVQVKELNSFPVFDGTNVLANYSFADSSGNNTHWMEVLNKAFTFDQNAPDLLVEKIRLIDAYYLADIQLKEGFQKLQYVNLENTEMLFEYQKVTDEVDLIIKDIEKFDFYHKLNTANFDPINFEERFSELYEANAELKQTLRYMISTLHEVYYSKGMHFLELGNKEQAKTNFNKAVNIKLMFAPAHYQLARMAYEEGNLDYASETALGIVTKMNPDYQTEQMTGDLLKNIVQTYVQQAKRFNDKAMFDRAEEELSKADQTISRYHVLVRTQSFKEEYTRMLGGKMERYLNMASEKIHQGKPEQAESSIKAAWILYDNNQSFLYDEPVSNITEELVFAYTEHANDDLNKGQFKNALEIIERAEYWCRKYKAVSCPENIETYKQEAYSGIYNTMLDETDEWVQRDYKKADSKLSEASHYRNRHSIQKNDKEERIYKMIRTEECKSNFNKGIEKNKEGNEKAALSYFEKSKKLCMDNSLIELLKEVEELISRVSKQYIIEIIQTGEKHISENKVPLAKRDIKEARKVMDQYNVQTDEIMQLYSELKDKIFSQECKNAENMFANMIEQAREYISKKLYISA